MREFVVLYILYPNLINPTQVLYLKKIKKDKAPKNIWNKLVGLGGEVEGIDKRNLEYIFNATRREIKEEIGLKIDEKHTIVYCGKNNFKSENRIVHFLKVGLENKISQKYILNEGEINYFPIDYHKINPKDFPFEDLKLLDKIFFSNNSFVKDLE